MITAVTTMTDLHEELRDLHAARFAEISALREMLVADGDGVHSAVTADRLRSILRTSDDLAARIGGDELLVVLHGVQDMDNAVAIAEKLHTAAAQPVSTPAGPVTATLSIGVTLARPDETTDTLVARADSAMYRAKHSGRNRIVPFEGEASPLTP
jgi:diguanylate cyclase (GGDEF)-like protein